MDSKQILETIRQAEEEKVYRKNKLILEKMIVRFYSPLINLLFRLKGNCNKKLRSLNKSDKEYIES